MLKRSTGLAAGLAVLVLVPTAFAAPVTVDLRVEGANGTLFEGPVTTDVRTFHFTGESAAHQCDGTAANAGTSPSPAPTRGAALVASGLAIAGDWSDQFGNPTINEVAGENVAYDAGTQRFLAEYKNGVSANVGSCGDPVGPGDDVLFAYAAFRGSRARPQRAHHRPPGPDGDACKVTDAATGVAGRRRERRRSHHRRRRHSARRAVLPAGRAGLQGDQGRRDPVQPAAPLRERRQRRVLQQHDDRWRRRRAGGERHGGAGDDAGAEERRGVLAPARAAAAAAAS